MLNEQQSTEQQTNDYPLILSDVDDYESDDKSNDMSDDIDFDVADECEPLSNWVSSHERASWIVLFLIKMSEPEYNIEEEDVDKQKTTKPKQTTKLKNTTLFKKYNHQY